MLRIHWTARKRNEDEILRTIRKQQMHFTGHIIKAKKLEDRSQQARYKEKEKGGGVCHATKRYINGTGEVIEEMD